MDIRQLLEKLGHKDLLCADWYGYVAEWLKWYAGKASWHRYTIYNGESTIKCERKSLGMAKKVSEDKADLLLNEKVEITVTPKQVGAIKSVVQKVTGSTASQEFVDAVLQDNNFWVRGNQLVELANAIGTGAFVEFMDGKDVRIDYVPASCIWPISWSNGNITECAFASHLSGEKTYVQRHLLHDAEGNALNSGKYIVFNDLFDKEGNKLELPQGVLPEWRTNSVKPVYQIITPNICNNIDIANPMGISVYANSIDDLKTIDVVYDSLYNEFNLGKKRVYVPIDKIKIDVKTGEPLPVFDPNDTVFYALPGDDGKNLIQESDMELRVDDHVTALQAALDVYSEKCGLGKGYYKFDVDNVQTATAVVSQNSKLFRRVKKDEIILEKALVDMTQAILFLGGKGEADVSVSFDDSIIEDTDAIANRAMREQGAGIIDDVEYFMITRDLEEEAAQELVDKIAKRRPPEPEPPEMFGGA